MADIADRANSQVENFDNQVTKAFKARREAAKGATSRFTCKDCGDTIPEPRRAALPMCTTCVRCAQLEEKRMGFR